MGKSSGLDALLVHVLNLKSLTQFDERGSFWREDQAGRADSGPGWCRSGRFWHFPGRQACEKSANRRWNSAEIELTNSGRVSSPSKTTALRPHAESLEPGGMKRSSPGIEPKCRHLVDARSFSQRLLFVAASLLQIRQVSLDFDGPRPKGMNRAVDTG